MTKQQRSDAEAHTLRVPLNDGTEFTFYGWYPRETQKVRVQ